MTPTTPMGLPTRRPRSGRRSATARPVTARPAMARTGPAPGEPRSTTQPWHRTWVRWPSSRKPSWSDASWRRADRASASTGAWPPSARLTRSWPPPSRSMPRTATGACSSRPPSDACSTGGVAPSTSTRWPPTRGPSPTMPRWSPGGTSWPRASPRVPGRWTTSSVRWRRSMRPDCRTRTPTSSVASTSWCMPMTCVGDCRPRATHWAWTGPANHWASRWRHCDACRPRLPPARRCEHAWTRWLRWPPTWPWNCTPTPMASMPIPRPSTVRRHAWPWCVA